MILQIFESSLVTAPDWSGIVLLLVAGLLGLAAQRRA